MVRLAIAAALLLATSLVSHAFTIAPPSLGQSVSAVSFTTHHSVRLNMVNEQEPEETVAEESVAEETSESTEETTTIEEELEEKQEDPEVTELKQEIANLESALKARERDLMYQQEKLEEYSKGGYARRVAEMETMRRARSVSHTTTCCCCVLQ